MSQGSKASKLFAKTQWTATAEQMAQVQLMNLDIYREHVIITVNEVSTFILSL